MTVMAGRPVLWLGRAGNLERYAEARKQDGSSTLGAASIPWGLSLRGAGAVAPRRDGESTMGGGIPRSAHRLDFSKGP